MQASCHCQIWQVPRLLLEVPGQSPILGRGQESLWLTSEGKYTKARSNKARSNRVVKIVKPGRNFENPSDASYKNVNIVNYVIYYIEKHQKGVILTVEVFLFSIKFLNHSDLE